MHQPHGLTEKYKNHAGLFRVGWMHLLGMVCVILFSLLVEVCLLMVWGYAEKLVLVSVVLGSAFLNPLVWNLIDRLAENNERERTQLLERLEEQQYILKEIWLLTESVSDGYLSAPQVQLLFLQSIGAFYQQRRKPTDQIPTAEQYSVLRDICEESWFWILDTIRSVLRLGLHKIIYYLSSLFYPQRKG
jgi:hypothetical protein